jgi:hypothetical protein
MRHGRNRQEKAAADMAGDARDAGVVVAVVAALGAAANAGETGLRKEKGMAAVTASLFPFGNA